jgi:2'-5' RNA ligase
LSANKISILAAQINTLMTGYKDYFLLLSPGEKVIQTIKLCKLLTKSYINDFSSANSKAHISIAHYYRQKPYIIESFIDTLEADLKTLPCIHLQLDNFSFFPHTDDRVTMYAAIKNTYKVDNWLTDLKRCLRYNQSFTPHITVAKTIRVDEFYKVWPRFYCEKYEEQFLVDTLHILERETLKADDKWRLYKSIKFDGSRIIN